MQKDFLEKIRDDIRNRLLDKGISLEEGVSWEFKTFKVEEAEQRGFNYFYEVYCAFSLKYLKFRLPKKARARFESTIEVSGLNISPEGVFAATVMTFLTFFLLFIPFFILFGTDILLFAVFFTFFFTYTAYTYPFFMEQLVKIRSQEESLLAILYITIYLRLNPVFELAVEFATKHLDGPLKKDLQRILWMVEAEKVPNIQKAIEAHISLWVKRNPTFVRSILIIQEILVQQKQKEVLDKALNTILNDTYINMKHYAQDLEMPVTILHIFGMMLPLIGLVAFPLINMFMSSSLNVWNLFLFYILILPFFLFYISKKILSKRPGAFSFPDISIHPSLPPKGKFLLRIKGKEILIPVLPVAVVLGLIITLPGIVHLFTSTLPALAAEKPVTQNILLQEEYSVRSFLISLTIPVGIAVGCIVYFLGQSIQRRKIRQRIIDLEDDFSDTLFQLSNKFEENIPIEMSIKKFLYEYRIMGMKKKSVCYFFEAILDKIGAESLTFRQAVFGKTGVILLYPSILVKEIMWIIVEGAKKGAVILHNITNRISIYLQNTKKLKELVHDLLNPISTSINIHSKFMAPLLSAIVGSLTLVLIRALYLLSKRIEEVLAMFDMGSVSPTVSSGTGVFGDFFNFAKIIPPTLFQIMVGIYLIEIVILMSYVYNGVKNGFDKVEGDFTIGKNLAVAISVYSILVVIGVLMLQQLLIRTLSVGIS